MSTIAEITFDKNTNTVNFVFSYDVERVYTITRFSPAKAKAWMNADSKGSFYHANIKNQYKTRIEKSMR